MKKFFKVLVISLLCTLVFVQPASAAKLKKTPAITKIITTPSYITLNWDKAKSSKGYEVYRKEQGKKKYTKIASVSKKAISYKDKRIRAGKKYYYKIRNKISQKKYYTSKVKGITAANMKTPLFTNLKTYTKNGKVYAQLTWKSIPGSKYYLYRKKTGSNSAWKRIRIIQAKQKSTIYTDYIGSSGDYTYTMRRMNKVEPIISKFSEYDKKGISTIRKKPDVQVDFTNLNAVVNWKKVSGADGYMVYRKYKAGGSYKKVGNVKGGSKTSYKDTYRFGMSAEDKEKLLLNSVFADPTANGFVYTVRAYKKANGGYSYSDYYADGDFHMDPPSIVSVSKQSDTEAEIEWGTIPNAQQYSIYSGYADAAGNKSWTKAATVKAESGVRQKTNIRIDASHTYFTVKAEANRNGEIIESGFDEGYYIGGESYEDTNVLFLGDSITYASPYYHVPEEKEVFSYPWRINQLTNIQYYNPSIPGSTYTYREKDLKYFHRYRLVKDVAEKIHDGVTPVLAEHPNDKTYKDFDVVVLAAGTNDYLDDAVIGDIDSTDIREFNGALNQIMAWIKEGSEQRIEEGKAPIKVVFVELFYSDRTYKYGELTDRRVQKNGLGLTLTNYQSALDRIAEKYRDEGMDIYHFATNHIVTQQNCPYATSDNLHMTRYTYTQIGNYFTEFLINNGILRKEKEPEEQKPDEKEPEDGKPDKNGSEEKLSSEDIFDAQNSDSQPESNQLPDSDSGNERTDGLQQDGQVPDGTLPENTEVDSGPGEDMRRDALGGEYPEGVSGEDTGDNL